MRIVIPVYEKVCGSINNFCDCRWVFVKDIEVEVEDPKAPLASGIAEPQCRNLVIDK